MPGMHEPTGDQLTREFFWLIMLITHDALQSCLSHLFVPPSAAAAVEMQHAHPH